MLVCYFPMPSFVTTNIFDEIQISEDIEISFYSLLRNIKHCCKTKDIYRDIYRDICYVVYRAIFL